MAEIITREEIQKKFNNNQSDNKEGKSGEIQKKRVVGYCRVSTDKDEQQDSFENQKKHFENLEKEHSDWQLVNIYQDFGISGGSIAKREGFKTMIKDACNGELDVIVVKNLSRFARNTIDTLNTVKTLLEHKVSVIFEEEHIDTGIMVNQMLLTFLSAICEQELINTSNHVKQTFKNKMKENKLVGSHRCLGYDCDIKANTMTIIPDEAKVVKYIYKRYLEGAGCYVIARELGKQGIKTMKGNDKWNESVVRGILTNEVYIGNVIQGKTITIDPLNHRRLDNKGEQEMYRIYNHHEAIIKEKDFNAVQKILNDRRQSLKSSESNQVDKKSRKLNTKMYPFSSILFCGFCGDTFTHRKLHAGTKNEKEAWACCTAYKEGKAFCPDSKTIDQDAIEKAFVEAFNKFTCGQTNVIDEYIKMAEKTLDASENITELKELNKKIDKAKADNDKILNIMLNESSFDKKMLYEKVADNNELIRLAEEKKQELNFKLENRQSNEERLKELKDVIASCSSMTEFNKDIFLAVVDKVIIGRIDEEGNKHPYDITFIFKTGEKMLENGELFKAKRGRKKMCTYNSHGTCRDGSIDVKKR